MEPSDLAGLFRDCGISVPGSDLEDEFRFADLKGDGVLTLDEFAIYHQGVLRAQAGLQRSLQGVFDGYNAYGKSQPDLFMDSRALAHLCKDAKLIGGNLRLGDVDVIHTKVRTKGERKISFEQFVYALALVAEARGESLDVVIGTVLRAGPPRHDASGAAKVRLHDDKSTYTGVYKRGGPTNFDGGANIDLSYVTNRKAADARGVDQHAKEQYHTYGEKAPARPAAGAQGPGSERGVDELESAMTRLSSRPSGVQDPAAGDANRGEIRVELDPTGDMEQDLRNVFEAYNIFDGGDPETMSGRAWVKLFRDRGLVKKTRGLTTVALDLLFTRIKPKGSKRISFPEFKRALEAVASEHLQRDFHEVALLVIAGGGPVAIGTIPDDFNYDGGEPGESSRAASAAPPQPRSPAAAPTDAAEAAIRDLVPIDPRGWDDEVRAVHELFQEYNTFGGKSDALNMDGRTFVKLCREKGVLVKPLTGTDADIVFAAVRKPPIKTISFHEFCVALAKLVERSQGALPPVDRVLRALSKIGGVESSGKQAEYNRFYDDKGTWTGVALRGGPSNQGGGNSTY